VVRLERWHETACMYSETTIVTRRGVPVSRRTSNLLPLDQHGERSLLSSASDTAISRCSSAAHAARKDSQTFPTTWRHRTRAREGYHLRGQGDRTEWRNGAERKAKREGTGIGGLDRKRNERERGRRERNEVRCGKEIREKWRERERERRESELDGTEVSSVKGDWEEVRKSEGEGGRGR
jgi:hypothetical protein